MNTHRYMYIHVYNYLYVNTHVCVKYLFIYLSIYLCTEDDFMSPSLAPNHEFKRILRMLC